MNSVIDKCEFGHTFAKLPDHPTRDGSPRCPHCLAMGFDKLRGEQVPAYLDFDELKVKLTAGSKVELSFYYKGELMLTQYYPLLKGDTLSLHPLEGKVPLNFSKH